MFKASIGDRVYHIHTQLWYTVVEVFKCGPMERYKTISSIGAVMYFSQDSIGENVYIDRTI